MKEPRTQLRPAVRRRRLQGLGCGQNLRMQRFRPTARNVVGSSDSHGDSLHGLYLVVVVVAAVLGRTRNLFPGAI